MTTNPLSKALRNLAAMIDQGSIDMEIILNDAEVIDFDDDSRQAYDLFIDFAQGLADL